VPLQPSASAARLAARVGWVLKQTNATGDCGPDCLAYFAGMPRTPMSWKSVRQELADFMLTVRDDPQWMAAFGACGEQVEAEPLPVEAPQALPSGPLPVPTRSPVADPPLPPQSDPVPPLVLLSSASPPSSLVLPPLPPPDDGPETFQAWLDSLPKDQLEDVTRDYHIFTLSRDRWERANPKQTRTRLPSKLVRRQTRLDHKRAVGVAYLKWRADEGSGSRAHLKE
jgi:hypothetical protein